MVMIMISSMICLDLGMAWFLDDSNHPIVFRHDNEVSLDRLKVRLLAHCKYSRDIAITLEPLDHGAKILTIVKLEEDITQEQEEGAIYQLLQP